jgi:hypothetical protein
MSTSIRRRLIPSPAMAVAFIALLVAIGGTSYAVVRLPARSVGSAQLKNNAVTAAKVKNEALTGRDIRESTLEGIAASGLSNVTIKTTTGTIPPAPSFDTPGVAAASAFCDAGQQAIAGGGRLELPDQGEIADSYPDAGGTVWSVHAANADLNSAHGFTAYAICVAKG